MHPINTNNCYCTQILSNGDSSFCGYYELSPQAVRGGNTCADLNGRYSDGLLSSADLLIAGVCAGLALALLSCVSLCGGVFARVPQFPQSQQSQLQQYQEQQQRFPRFQYQQRRLDTESGSVAVFYG